MPSFVSRPTPARTFQQLDAICFVFSGETCFLSLNTEEPISQEDNLLSKPLIGVGWGHITFYSGGVGVDMLMLFHLQKPAKIFVD